MTKLMQCGFIVLGIRWQFARQQKRIIEQVSHGMNCVVFLILMTGVHVLGSWGVVK